MADLKVLSDSIIKGDQKTAVDVTKAALDEGMAPGTILAEGGTLGETHFVSGQREPAKD